MQIESLIQDNPWITVWPNISVVLFTIIFTVIVIVVIKIKKNDIKKWETMPFDDDNNYTRN